MSSIGVCVVSHTSGTYSNQETLDSLHTAYLLSFNLLSKSWVMKSENSKVPVLKYELAGRFDVLLDTSKFAEEKHFNVQISIAVIYI